MKEVEFCRTNILYHAARCYAMLGEKESALDALRQVVSCGLKDKAFLLFRGKRSSTVTPFSW